MTDEDLEDFFEDAEIAYFQAVEIGEAIRQKRATGEITTATPGFSTPEEAAKEQLEANELCRSYLSLGRVHNSKEDEEEQAEENWAKAREMCPAEAMVGAVWKDMGMLAMRMTNYANAEEFLSKAVAADPKIKKGYSNLALAQQHLGKLDSARLTFETALDQDPKNANLHANYGTLLARAEEYSDAMDAFKVALKLNPNHMDAADKLKQIEELGHMDDESNVRFKPLSKRYIGPTPKVPN